MQICDMHTHTRNSSDSKATMEEYCVRALEIGVKTICFTDHVDSNKGDNGCGFYNADRYFDELDAVKAKYENKLTLLSGIEFSEPHMYGEELSRLNQHPYDFIIGSVHFPKGDVFLSDMVKQDVPATVCFEHYWDTVLKTADHGDFDCFGHFDFPKRYYKTLFYEEAKIREIFRCMLDNDICPEINTSSLRKGLETAMPDLDLLEIYKSLGGTYVTVGSDAHLSAYLGDGNDYARGLIAKLGLTEVIFVGRKRQIVK